MTQSENQLPDPFSKSRIKREAEALQKLGEALVALPESQLAKIPLPDNILEAIHLAHTLKAHEAKRRHMQYIGKIMRDVDPAPIEHELAKLTSAHTNHTAQFHKCERWRERLIEEGDKAAQVLLEEYPEVDRQQLRQLIRNAQHDRKTEKNTGAEKALFKRLREIIG